MQFDIFGNPVVEKKTKIIKKIKKLPSMVTDANEKISFVEHYCYDENVYSDFTNERYKFGMIFYDCEVFRHDWMFVFIDAVRNKRTVICNDKDALSGFYIAHSNEIFCGYNSKGYDQFIFKGILCGLNPKEINDHIIIEGKRGYDFNDLLKSMPILNFDIATKIQGLKQLEGFMGNDIRETEVPFDLPRTLTEFEIRMTEKYCIHDVEQTIEVFRKRSEVYDANMGIIEMFDFPMSNITLTQAQLTAKVTKCQKPLNERTDDWDLWVVDTVDIKKYSYVVDWFMSLRDNHDHTRIETYRNGKFIPFKSAKPHGDKLKFELHTDICGIPHIFAMGGLHGANDSPITVRKEKQIYHSDVNSLYPSIMIQYGLLTRNSTDPNKFVEVYNERLALKKIGEKKKQKSLKIVLNSQYGIMGDRHSSAYDMRNCKMVCITGQLLILTLLEKMERYITLIQTNTDGIIYTINDEEKDHDTVFRIISDWEKSTRLGFATDTIDWITQGTVNGYVFKFSNGEYERKGGYLKENNDLDNDLPIVNRAMFEYIAHNRDVRECIYSCDELIQFQKIVRISSNYKYGWHNGSKLNDKTYRIFAVKDAEQSYIGKQKDDGATIERFSDTPEHCIVVNEDIHDKKVSDYRDFDRDWYVNLALDRLEKQYGFCCKPNIFDMF